MRVYASPQTVASWCDDFGMAMTLAPCSLVPHVIAEETIGFGVTGEHAPERVQEESSAVARPLVASARIAGQAPWDAAGAPTRGDAPGVADGTRLARAIALLRRWLDDPVGRHIGREGLAAPASSSRASRALVKEAWDTPVKRLLFGDEVREPAAFMEIAYGILRSTAPSWEQLPRFERFRILAAQEKAERRGTIVLPRDIASALEASADAWRAAKEAGLFAGERTPPLRAVRGLLLSGLLLIRAGVNAWDGGLLADALCGTAVRCLEGRRDFDVAAMASELWTDALQGHRPSPLAHAHGFGVPGTSALWRWGAEARGDAGSDHVRIFQGLCAALAGASWSEAGAFYGRLRLAAMARGRHEEAGHNAVRKLQVLLFAHARDARGLDQRSLPRIAAMCGDALRSLRQIGFRNRALEEALALLKREVEGERRRTAL